MLSVAFQSLVVLNAIMLLGVTLNVVMLSVVAPFSVNENTK